ncbi:MAG: FtsX-like permease family protein [Roseiarcus sp.]
MIFSTRWRKLYRDFDAIPGRVLMAVAAIAIGIYAVSLIATAYTILTREISRNYLATNPASAIIDLGAVKPDIVEKIRRDPRFSGAEATSIVTARVELRSNEWVPLLLFVVPDFSSLSINKMFHEQGAWPPASDSILLEREALKFLGTKIGGSINVQVPTGPKTTVVVSGTVHDPSLAPSWQEQMAYGYLTPETYARLGGSPTPGMLKLVVRDALHDQKKVDTVVGDLAQTLIAEGERIHQIQTPPTGLHPHQGQMTAVLTTFLMFALLALVLSAFLAASMIDGLLAQQVRQIAVMKAIGARSRQIVGLYLAGILAITLIALVIGLPLGVLSGRGFASVIAQLLNFEIASCAIAPLLVSILAAGAVAIPIVFAMIPIGRAARMTVHEAISDYGVSDAAATGRLDKFLTLIRGVDRTLLLAIRNAFRKRGRLILTLALLAAAGAMFIASLSVQTAWDYFIASSAHDRNYDLELRFDRPVAAEKALSLIASVPRVSKVEPWSVTPAAKARPDGLTIVRTYPDGGHASLDLRSVPRSDSLSHLVLLDGSWPEALDDDAIVINQSARTLLGGPKIGDSIPLTVSGRSHEYRLVGVVRQIVTLPATYVSAHAFEAVTGSQGQLNAVRIVADTHDAAAVSALSEAIETRLASVSIRVVKSISETQMDRAVGGHVKILVVSLIAMSILMAAVGLLGLASAQGVSVAERTREFGVMRAIGGTNRVIIRNVIAEGVFISLTSFLLALILAAPLAVGVGRLVGILSFGLPLPLMISHLALGLWLSIVIFGAIGASLLPALAAARLTIRETLAHI